MNSEAVERACKEAAKTLGYQTLKDHQLLVVSSLVKGNDVFGVLPTSYGPCFAILPLVFDQLMGTNELLSPLSLLL